MATRDYANKSTETPAGKEQDITSVTINGKTFVPQPENVEAFALERLQLLLNSVSEENKTLKHKLFVLEKEERVIRQYIDGLNIRWEYSRSNDWRNIS